MREGIMIYHVGRCGSTVLTKLLNQNPKLMSFGEVFLKSHRQGRLVDMPDNILRLQRVSAFPKRAIVEVKFLERQHLSVIGQSVREFVDCAYENGFRKSIILNRENYLRIILSRAIAVARGDKWHIKKEDQVSRTQVNLDVERIPLGHHQYPMFELFEYIDSQYQELREALDGTDATELTYEKDILTDPRIAYGKVCRWLGLPEEPVSVTLQRTNTQSLRESIVNWKEVAMALKDTKYSWMLEE
jgi:hypothetical protein